MDTLCRDCGRQPHPDAEACPSCGSARIARHEELHGLAIAHLDCDAFYAAIEKRDRPELRDRPVIVGGRHRGVVAACCYIARTYGVRSAMPMFQALKACPDATAISPDMRKYAAVGREVRAMMQELTPLVEPLSIDEAFMDLAGTESLHRRSPATTLAVLARRVEKELSITVSIGLSYARRPQQRGAVAAGFPELAQNGASVCREMPGISSRIGRLEALGGFVFYVEIRTTAAPSSLRCPRWFLELV